MFFLEQLSPGAGFWKQGAAGEGADMLFNSAASPCEEGRISLLSPDQKLQNSGISFSAYSRHPGTATGAGPWVMWLSSAGDSQGLPGRTNMG